MHRRFKHSCAWGLIVSVLLTGCQPMQPFYLHDDGDLSHYLDVATEIEYTDVGQEPLDEVRNAQAPRTVANPQFNEFWDLTLEDAISIALQNSKVIRTFGQVRQFGQIVGGPPERLSVAPDSVATIYDPAIQETGQSGVEQALAAFDAVFSSTATWDNTDRLQNLAAANVGNQSFVFQQDQVQFNNEVSKLSANGTQWFFRNVSIYSGANNALTANPRDVPSDWFTALEAEMRQPLLRNRGTQVNRIPIVLARIRTDLSLVDFEVSVRELLSSVERAYWELYFFYQNLRTAKTGRDSAWAAWQKVNALYQQGSDGGEAEKEAQAREQYFRFRALLEDAQRDLFKSESRLRFLMGLAPTDDRLIRPADAPTAARVTFDWNLVHCEALARREELRRQKWRVQQREMELIAARNQLLPQMDIVALYRWLGNGDQLISGRRARRPDGTQVVFPGAAFKELWGGDFQEYRLGFEANIPLGFRREMSQVRSSQLAVARERAKLEDMELEIDHQLTDAIQDLEAGHRSLITHFSRRMAAEEQVEATDAAFQAGTVPLDLLLEAQRRQAEASITYYQSLVDYNISIMAVHLRKGSLLDYDGVLLSEGPWPAKAYFDAVNRARQRDASHYLNYGYSRPRVLSRGPVPGSGDEVTGQPGPLATDQPIENLPSAAEPLELKSDSDATQPLTEDLERALDAVTGDEPGFERLPEPTPAQPIPAQPSDSPSLEFQPGPQPSDDPQLDNGLQLDNDLQLDNGVQPGDNLQLDDLEARRPARQARAEIRFSGRRPTDTAEARGSGVAESRVTARTVVRSDSVEIEWRD